MLVVEVETEGEIGRRRRGVEVVLLVIAAVVRLRIDAREFGPVMEIARREGERRVARGEPALCQRCASVGGVQVAANSRNRQNWPFIIYPASDVVVVPLVDVPKRYAAARACFHWIASGIRLAGAELNVNVRIWLRTACYTMNHLPARPIAPQETAR